MSCDRDMQQRSGRHLAPSQVPVYVISLGKAATRRRHISEHLGHLGVAFEFVDAVDAAQIERAKLQDLLCETYAYPLGHVGCSLSHFQAYRRLMETDSDHALVLEDDVILDRQVVALLRPGVSEFSDLCFLGCDDFGAANDAGLCDRVVAYNRASVRRVAQVFDVATLSHGPYRLHAYFITRQAAKKRLAEALPLRHPIDFYHDVKNEYVFESVIHPRLAWLSPLALSSSIEVDDHRPAVSLLGRAKILLKHYRLTLEIIQLVKRRKTRLRARLRRELVQHGGCPGDWDCLPWDGTDVLW